MRTLRPALSRPGLVFGALCGVVGLALQGPDRAVLWLLVGFFLGKSLQSALWTISGTAS